MLGSFPLVVLQQTTERLVADNLAFTGRRHASQRRRTVLLPEQHVANALMGTMSVIILQPGREDATPDVPRRRR